MLLFCLTHRTVLCFTGETLGNFEEIGFRTRQSFEEDPDIFVVLAGGVFYQTSYDGTEVAITADYPGLLPVSHVNN